MKKFLIFAAALIAALYGCQEKPVNPEEKDIDIPQNVVLHNATETSLTFQWAPVEGATRYLWKLQGEDNSVREGAETKRFVLIENLQKGTTYSFCVCAEGSGKTSAYSATIEGRTLGTAPGPVGPDGADAVCIDAPIVISFDSAPVLGTSGLIKVFTESGKEVDRIDMADMSQMTALEDGTLVPAGADADAGKIAIGNDYLYHTFMDALHSNQYRPVHYTPVRVKGKSLEIKLHNEALDFSQKYYVTLDESVAGKAIAAGELTFSTKSAPSGPDYSILADGSGDFCTVQGAISYISTLQKDSPVTISVGEGTFPELLFMRNRNNVTIKGVSREKTRIAYPNNDSYETGSGASLSSRPTLGKAIGKSGGRCVFLVEGCDNLVLENITIENTYSIPSHKGQAETIYFNSNYKLTLERCSLISWQDTFLCKGSVWVHNSLIAGHVDFIWGYPTACLLENCEIRARAGGYIVQARVPSAGAKGFVFLNCSLTAEEGVKDGSMYLARSAGQAEVFDNVTYVGCTMAPAIAPAGWYSNPSPNPTGPTAESGWKEYGSVDASGKSVMGSRNRLGKQLTATEAEAYSSKASVLGW